MGRGAETFLAAHPALVAARDRSSIWPRVLRDAAVDVGGRSMFIVGGDTLGDAADLYLDRLARGARAAGSDTLSRELFLELLPELQAIIQHELLRQGKGDT